MMTLAQQIAALQQVIQANIGVFDPRIVAVLRQQGLVSAESIVDNSSHTSSGDLEHVNALPIYQALTALLKLLQSLHAIYAVADGKGQDANFQDYIVNQLSNFYQNPTSWAANVARSLGNRFIGEDETKLLESVATAYSAFNQISPAAKQQLQSAIAIITQQGSHLSEEISNQTQNVVEDAANWVGKHAEQHYNLQQGMLQGALGKLIFGDVNGANDRIAENLKHINTLNGEVSSQVKKVSSEFASAINALSEALNQFYAGKYKGLGDINRLLLHIEQAVRFFLKTDNHDLLLALGQDGLEHMLGLLGQSYDLIITTEEQLNLRSGIYSNSLRNAVIQLEAYVTQYKITIPARYQNGMAEIAAEAKARLSNQLGEARAKVEYRIAQQELRLKELQKISGAIEDADPKVLRAILTKLGSDYTQSAYPLPGQDNAAREQFWQNYTKMLEAVLASPQVQTRELEGDIHSLEVDLKQLGDTFLDAKVILKGNTPEEKGQDWVERTDEIQRLLIEKRAQLAQLRTEQSAAQPAAKQGWWEWGTGLVSSAVNYGRKAVEASATWAGFGTQHAQLVKATQAAFATELKTLKDQRTTLISQAELLDYRVANDVDGQREAFNQQRKEQFNQQVESFTQALHSAQQQAWSANYKSEQPAEQKPKVSAREQLESFIRAYFAPQLAARVLQMDWVENKTQAQMWDRALPFENTLKVLLKLTKFIDNPPARAQDYPWVLLEISKELRQLDTRDFVELKNLWQQIKSISYGLDQDGVNAVANIGAALPVGNVLNALSDIIEIAQPNQMQPSAGRGVFQRLANELPQAAPGDGKIAQRVAELKTLAEKIEQFTEQLKGVNPEKVHPKEYQQWMRLKELLQLYGERIANSKDSDKLSDVWNVSFIWKLLEIYRKDTNFYYELLNSGLEVKSDAVHLPREILADIKEQVAQAYLAIEPLLQNLMFASDSIEQAFPFKEGIISESIEPLVNQYVALKKTLGLADEGLNYLSERLNHAKATMSSLAQEIEQLKTQYQTLSELRNSINDYRETRLEAMPKAVLQHLKDNLALVTALTDAQRQQYAELLEQALQAQPQAEGYLQQAADAVYFLGQRVGVLTVANTQLFDALDNTWQQTSDRLARHQWQYQRSKAWIEENSLHLLRKVNAHNEGRAKNQVQEAQVQEKPVRDYRATVSQKHTEARQQTEKSGFGKLLYRIAEFFGARRDHKQVAEYQQESRARAKSIGERIRTFFKSLKEYLDRPAVELPEVGSNISAMMGAAQSVAMSTSAMFTRFSEQQDMGVGSAPADKVAEEGVNLHQSNAISLKDLQTALAAVNGSRSQPISQQALQNALEAVHVQRPQQPITLEQLQSALAAVSTQKVVRQEDLQKALETVEQQPVVNAEDLSAKEAYKTPTLTPTASVF
ncbi:MAG: hypothetical protein Tsb005_11410 [Gammaproteobacteria bacterium]